MRAWQDDFPELYPLCRVRIIEGDLTDFCYGFAGADGMCTSHAWMRVSGKGEWTGEFELAGPAVRVTGHG